MRRTFLCLPVMMLALLPAVAGAEDKKSEPLDPTKAPPALAAAIAKLHPQHGSVTFADGLARFNLPPDLAYLTPDETDTFLREIVGFHGHLANLGAILPTSVDIGSEASWFTLVTYQVTGHASQDVTLDPEALLKRLQDKNKAHNVQLRQKGYPMSAIEIAGWEKEPHLNTNTHKLTWAFEIIRHNKKDRKINYNIRILGKNGMIGMSILSSIEQLPMMEDAMEKIAAATEFNEPNRYTDFKSGDPLAGFSLADMIVGDFPQAPAKPKPTPRAANDLMSQEYLLSLVILGGVVLIYQLKKYKKKKKKLTEPPAPPEA